MRTPGSAISSPAPRAAHSYPSHPPTHPLNQHPPTPPHPHPPFPRRYLLFAGDPYETIAFRIPSVEIDRDPSRLWTAWDDIRKVFTLQLHFRRKEKEEGGGKPAAAGAAADAR